MSWNIWPTLSNWFLLSAVAFAVPAGQATAQSNSVYGRHAGTLAQETDNPESGFRNGSFVVAPIPFSNPTIGSGLMLGLGYLFSADDASKPSVLGVGGMRSNNGSFGYAASASLALNNNTWLIKAMWAEADVRYDLFTPAATIPIRQDGSLGRLSFSYGVRPDLSLGVTARYLNTAITPDVPGLPPIPAPFNKFLNVEIATAGLVGNWDTRDDTLYPGKGLNLQFEATHSIALDGLVQDYSRAVLNHSTYHALGESSVLATRFSTCAASSDTPFFDQCSLGATDNFRGFSVTQFLDLRSLSFQAELRQKLTQRIRGVVFAGIGMVGPHYQDLDVGGTHAAGGIGVRYRISRKFPLDFSLDYSRNDQQENNLYIYVGQRF